MSFDSMTSDIVFSFCRYDSKRKWGKGAFNNYVDKMRGGGGAQKMAKFCPLSC